MSSFLQTLDGDLDFSSHKLVLVTELGKLVQQKARNTLRLFLGEWFLDTTKGVPWLQTILGVKNPDLAIVKQAIRSRLLAIEGAADIVDENYVFDSSARHLSYSFEIKCTDGSAVTVDQ